MLPPLLLLLELVTQRSLRYVITKIIPRPTASTKLNFCQMRTVQLSRMEIQFGAMIKLCNMRICPIKSSSKFYIKILAKLYEVLLWPAT